MEAEKELKQMEKESDRLLKSLQNHTYEGDRMEGFKRLDELITAIDEKLDEIDKENRILFEAEKKRLEDEVREDLDADNLLVSSDENIASEKRDV